MQAHPRHTANYLKLIREKESAVRASASGQSANRVSASGSAVKEDSGKEDNVVEIKLKMPKLSSYMEPLPILPKGKYYESSPTWRKKRIKQQQAAKRAHSEGSNESQHKKEKEKRKQNEQYLEQL